MKIVAAIRRFSPGLPHYLFAAVFSIRILALVRLSGSPLFLPARGDMHFYNEWAQRILRGDVDLHSAFYGLPLYPYILAVLYRLFGYSPFIPGVFQALMDSATGVLIYLLTLKLVRGTAVGPQSPSPAEQATRPAKIFAVLAVAGWAFFVPAQAYSVVLMPTAWFVLVFWFVVWRVAKTTESPGTNECALLGLLLGFTAMAIATALFLIPIVIAAIFLRRDAGRLGVALWQKTGFFAIGIVLGTSPCWVHNYVLARDPVFLSAHGGVNFWIGNNPTANGYPKFPPGLRAGQAAMLEDSITSAENALGRPLKRAEVSAYWSNKAREYISTHPVDWLRLLLTKARNFWNAFQYDDLSIITNLREQQVVGPGLYFGLVAALAIPGMIFAWRRSTSSRWITAAILLHMAALMTVFVTERYRLPIVPGLIVLSAYGLWVLWRELAAARYAQATVHVVVLLAAVVFVSWPQRDPALWALDAYNSGWQALECGDLPLAKSKLTVARRYVPTNPETNFAFGNLRFTEGDKSGAVFFYRTTLKYDANHRGALNNLGRIALDDSRFDLAESCLRRAEQLDHRDAKTHYLLAKALLGKGNRDAASAEIDAAMQLRPGQAEFTQLKDKISSEIP